LAQGLLDVVVDINRSSTVEMLADWRSYNERLVRSMNRLTTGQRAATAKDDPTLWSEVEELKQFASLLSGFSSNLNRAAATVRVAIDSMSVVKDHLAQAEDALSRAYAEAPGSKNRELFLESYNQFLRFIDDAAKAPDAGARRLLDSPANLPDAGDIQISAGENNYFVTLRAREVHTGANGLDLPRTGEAIPSAFEADPLTPPVLADPANATNDEIKALLDLIGVAKNTLSDKTKALTVDAASIEDSEVFNTVFIVRNKNLSEKINVPNLQAEAILAKSIQVKSALALNGLGTSTKIGQLAIQLIR
jgi:flagellin-like hook-associated protein FlgL